MRLTIMVSVLALTFAAGSAYAQTHVRGYTRSNGTYVAPHMRSAPDGDFSNNYSTRGNTNPYTGQAGTRVTPPNQGFGSDSLYNPAPRPNSVYDPY